MFKISFSCRNKNHITLIITALCDVPIIRINLTKVVVNYCKTKDHKLTSKKNRLINKTQNLP